MRLPYTSSRTAAVLRPGRFRVAAAALASATAIVALAGCAGVEYQEAICSSGEYPVMSVGGTGSACVSDKQEPPAGFVRYPEGKVPQHVDDTWDVYWDTHTLDKDGNIIDAPDAG
ncbi:SCO0607 family lipoprotein [Streptomyces sp. NPDC058084]|uniref:SCO0607 family lipoprotein n=1 Tax=Streptomyces sp. NPDC058084 TaxID=3346333 RepID=UPI0036E85EF3